MGIEYLRAWSVLTRRNSTTVPDIEAYARIYDLDVRWCLEIFEGLDSVNNSN